MKPVGLAESRPADVHGPAGSCVLFRSVEQPILASWSELCPFDGFGDEKATLILAAIEFARRRIKPESSKFKTPADMLPHVRHYADRKHEHFLCATINRANEILNI